MKTNFFLTAVLCVCCTFHETSSFSFNKLKNAARTRKSVASRKIIPQSPQQTDSEELSRILVEGSADATSPTTKSNNNLQQSLFAGCITFLTTTPLSAFAVDDLEIEELPPVYVPILFAIGVLGGVGVLTASLGNVMDEGECWDFLR